MGNEKKITFVNQNDLDDVIEGNLLCAFEMDDNKYIIYNKNEKDFEGNEVIYFGKIIIDNDMQYIKNLNDDEHNKIKNIIKKIINYSGDEDDA